MKKIMAFILAFICFSGIGLCERQKDLRKDQYPKHLQTLTLSASSKYSHADAMNRFARIKPDGYAIESIQYLKLKNNFVVLVKLIKV